MFRKVGGGMNEERSGNLEGGQLAGELVASTESPREPALNELTSQQTNRQEAKGSMTSLLSAVLAKSRTGKREA